MDYIVDINDFHGPLDLLLHLVKSSEMDIYSINTSLIIEKYLEYINKMQDLNIDIASSFIVMAATLIHLKSKMLIGKLDENEEEDNEFDINSEEDLKNRLIEYEKYKNMTEVFKELEENRNKFYTKAPVSLKEFTDSVLTNDGSITTDDLVNAFLMFKERIALEKPVNTKITRRELSVEDKIKSIKDKLKTVKKVNFIDLFESATKDHIIVTFLAILQMGKNKEVSIYQENNFENIFIEARWKKWIY